MKRSILFPPRTAIRKTLEITSDVAEILPLSFSRMLLRISNCFSSDVGEWFAEDSIGRRPWLFRSALNHLLSIASVSALSMSAPLTPMNATGRRFSDYDNQVLSVSRFGVFAGKIDFNSSHFPRIIDGAAWAGGAQKLLPPRAAISRGERSPSISKHTVLSR